MYRAFEGSLKTESIIMRLSAIYRDFDFVPGKTLIFLDEIQNCLTHALRLNPLHWRVTIG